MSELPICLVIFMSLQIHNFLISSPILLKLYLIGLYDFSGSIESKFFLEWTCPLRNLKTNNGNLFWSSLVGMLWANIPLSPSKKPTYTHALSTFASSSSRQGFRGLNNPPPKKKKNIYIYIIYIYNIYIFSCQSLFLPSSLFFSLPLPL